MRIFVALDIDGSVRQLIERFLAGVRELAPQARWLSAESLHVTLKFIGERPEGSVEEIRKALRGIKVAPIALHFGKSGFFPSSRSPRVFWIGVDGGRELAQLAALVDGITSKMGVRQEDHAFSPHLTLARAGKSGTPRWQKGDGPNPVFKRLQEELTRMPQPDFGTMTAHEFYLFESKLSSRGAQYRKVERYELE